MSVFSWLKPATLATTVIVAGSLLASAPVQAQAVTVLRGSPPQPSSPIDCSNPYYSQYCQVNNAGNDQNYSSYGYGDDYPYYGYGFPVGLGAGRGFFHRGGFHGGFHGGFRHRFFFHRGGFRGGGFHGGGFHGGGFHGGGFHGGGGHR
jgi:hypothetical protein